MKPAIIYMLEVLVCSGVLLAAYAILLERRVKFRWCRLYLLLTTFAAALIPLLRIPVWPGRVVAAAPAIPPDLPVWMGEVLPDEGGSFAVTPEIFCLGLYLLGAVLIAGVMAWQVFRIHRLRRGAEISRTGDYTLVRTRQEIASFSFLRTIYVWDKTPAGELAAMGYDEVNLNLGCPSGTVVAKGKGAGLLGAPEALDRMLDRIFSGSPVAVSLKTRLGLEEPEEFARLLEIFGRYPVSLLIIHPRVRKDFYRHPVRMECFEQAVDTYPGPLCFNGGLVTPADCARLASRFSQVDRVMIGQGLLADPALVQKAKGGPGAGRETLRAFHDELYHTYLEIFASQRNTVFHMKELWSYLGRLFQGAEKALKQIRKAADSPTYESAVAQIFALPLRQDACWEEE